MKIYTKTGDMGETGLFGAGRVSKSHERVEAYGTVDELNTQLGVLLTHSLPEPASDWLRRIQNELFNLGSDLATPPSTTAKSIVRVAPDAAEWLEGAIDTMMETVPPLRQFVLPGGVPEAALAHVARTVCRRAERRVVALHEVDDVNAAVMVYLNRLSDFFFTLARWFNDQAGQDEPVWEAS